MAEELIFVDLGIILEDLLCGLRDLLQLGLVPRNIPGGLVRAIGKVQSLGDFFWQSSRCWGIANSSHDDDNDKEIDVR